MKNLKNIIEYYEDEETICREYQIDEKGERCGFIKLYSLNGYIISSGFLKNEMLQGLLIFWHTNSRQVSNILILKNNNKHGIDIEFEY